METVATIATWFLIFVSYSFIGWALEVALGIFIEKRLRPVNRGFLIGPICPIYGFGALLITLVIGQTESVLAIFAVSFIGGAILEYITSYIMEKLFHVRWWDYDNMAFNVNGRVCLQCLVMFGVLGVLVIKVLNPLFLGIYGYIPDTPRLALAIIVFVILAADIIISLWLIIKCRVAVGTAERDATEEITENIRKILLDKGKLDRRLAKAFPNMKAKQKPPRAPRKKTSTPKNKTTTSKSTKQSR